MSATPAGTPSVLNPKGQDLKPRSVREAIRCKLEGISCNLVEHNLQADWFRSEPELADLKSSYDSNYFVLDEARD